MAKKKPKTGKQPKSKTGGDINLMEGKRAMDNLTELLHSLGQQDAALKKVQNPNNWIYPRPVKGYPKLKKYTGPEFFDC